MKANDYLKTTLALVAMIAATATARAQIAAVDISNPTNPIVTYDQNPYATAPDLPDDPTKIYVDAFTLPVGTVITEAENKDTNGLTFTGEQIALLNAGVVESEASIEFGQYEALAPAVITSDTPPDTYSLTPASVYYVPPTNEPTTVSTANTGPFYFDFGTVSSPVASGYTRVSDKTLYSAALGYGWGDTNVSAKDRGVTSDPLGSDFCLPSNDPFYVDLSNGTYNVSVLMGDAQQKSSMVVRGNGLLELYNMGAPTGQYLQQSFPITITNNRLRLEFAGSICHVNAVTITRDDSPHKPTIYVASDSTSAAYTQYQYPITGWGDRMQMYMSSSAVVDDQAKAGRSVKSFYEEGALDTIVNRIHTNDYLFVMSAINDSAKTGNRLTDPSSSYKAYLRLYVNAARSHGATPVFVTSQTKRTYDPYGRFFNSVGAYPQAMRELGQELNVPILDLNNKSIALFNAVGPNATTNMFMFFPPGQYAAYPNGSADYIHFQERGAIALGKQVVDGIRELKLPIAQYVLPVPQPAFRPTGRGAYQLP